MSYTDTLDVIATKGNFRARLEYDNFPNCPDDSDGTVPVIRVGGDYSSSDPASAFNSQAGDFDEAYNRFAECARNNSHRREIFARYVRPEANLATSLQTPQEA